MFYFVTPASVVRLWVLDCLLIRDQLEQFLIAKSVSSCSVLIIHREDDRDIGLSLPDSHFGGIYKFETDIHILYWLQVVALSDQ